MLKISSYWNNSYYLNANLMTLTACPVCNSSFIFPIDKVKTRRTKRFIQLYACLECLSFCNPSGYREDEQQLEKDLQWNISVTDRNYKAAERLYKKLRAHNCSLNSILDIGCGIGTNLLVVKKEYNSVVKGYDINNIAAKYARESNGVDVSEDYWTADTEDKNFSMLLSISCLEHVEQPRNLINEMVTYVLKSEGCKGFISVPFIEKDRWHYIRKKDPHEKGTPFFDNDVHITHFSIDGLTKALTEFGVTETEFVQAGLWNGIIFS